jgi:hypothetical protein
MDRWWGTGRTMGRLARAVDCITEWKPILATCRTCKWAILEDRSSLVDKGGWAIRKFILLRVVMKCQLEELVILKMKQFIRAVYFCFRKGQASWCKYNQVTETWLGTVKPEIFFASYSWQCHKTSIRISIVKIALPCTWMNTIATFPSVFYSAEFRELFLGVNFYALLCVCVCVCVCVMLCFHSSEWIVEMLMFCNG